MSIAKSICHEDYIGENQSPKDTANPPFGLFLQGKVLQGEVEDVRKIILGMQSCDENPHA